MATEIVESVKSQQENKVITPNEGEWNTMRAMAKRLISAGFYPKSIKNENQALIVMLTGRELGIPAMMSIRSIFVVDQKPCISAQMMKALVEREKAGKFEMESSATKAIVTSTRLDVKGAKPFTTIWTIENAKTAGLLYKDNWKKYPQEMLLNRAIADNCRFNFPDLLAGMYTPEEIVLIDSQEVIEETIEKPTEEKGLIAAAIKEQENRKKQDPEKPQPIRVDQITAIHGAWSETKKTDEEYREFLKEIYAVKTCKDLSAEQAAEAIEAIGQMIVEATSEDTKGQEEDEVRFVNDDDETPPEETEQEKNPEPEESKMTVQEIKDKILETGNKIDWQQDQIVEFLEEGLKKKKNQFSKSDWIKALDSIEKTKKAFDGF